MAVINLNGPSDGGNCFKVTASSCATREIYENGIIGSTKILKQLLFQLFIRLKITSIAIWRTANNSHLINFRESLLSRG